MLVKAGSGRSLSPSAGPSKTNTKSDGCKKSGWRAHESLKHFDDNIIDLIESEVYIDL